MKRNSMATSETHEKVPILDRLVARALQEFFFCAKGTLLLVIFPMALDIEITWLTNSGHLPRG